MTDLAIGAVLGPWTDPPLTVTDFVRYQGASGDMNPVHHDSEVARSVGYDQPLGVGMYTAGRLATCLTDMLGPRQVRRFAVRFKEPVWPGDVLTYEAVVASLTTSDLGTTIEVALTCARQTGGVHLSGDATFTLP